MAPKENKLGQPMSFADKSIHCIDCRALFTFTAAEQEFYAYKGFGSQPKLCSLCRGTRKQQYRGLKGAYRSLMD